MFDSIADLLFENKKAVRLELNMNKANFKPENTYGNYIRTYHLPTLSMVKGMVHKVLNANKLYKMKISIQGKHSGTFLDLKSLTNNIKGEFRRGVKYVEYLNNINIVIHIMFDEKNLMKEFCDRVGKDIIYLGCSDGLININSCEIIKLLKPKKDIIFTENNIFIDYSYCKNNNIVGTYYRLPFEYNIVKNFRKFNFIDAVFVSSNIINYYKYSKCIFYTDNKHYLINFLG